jgi:hypothetical protein
MGYSPLYTIFVLFYINARDRRDNIPKAYRVLIEFCKSDIFLWFKYKLQKKK